MKILCTKFKTTAQMLSLSLIAIILATLVAITNTGTVYFGYALRRVPIYSVKTDEKKSCTNV